MGESSGKNRRAIQTIRMAIVAAERAIQDIKDGMPIEHSASSFGTNASAALREMGAYAERDHIGGRHG